MQTENADVQNSPIVYSGLVEKLARISASLMPSLPYHNFNHVVDVYSMTTLYAIEERVSPEDMFLLQSAAMLHDIILVPMHPENEQKSAQFAKTYLPQLGYTPGQIEKVSRIILATKLPTNPKDLLEQIICDADIDNLGRQDFFEKSELVRTENGLADDLNWYKARVSFLDGMRFYTCSAQKLRKETKARNREKSVEMLNRYIQGYSVGQQAARVIGNEVVSPA